MSGDHKCSTGLWTLLAFLAVARERSSRRRSKSEHSQYVDMRRYVAAGQSSATNFVPSSCNSAILCIRALKGQCLRRRLTLMHLADIDLEWRGGRASYERLGAI